MTHMAPIGTRRFNVRDMFGISRFEIKANSPEAALEAAKRKGLKFPIIDCVQIEIDQREHMARWFGGEAPRRFHHNLQIGH